MDIVQTAEQGVWQLQEAKSRFSEVIKRTANAPQTITVRGEETAVIISVAKYKNLTQPKMSLFEFMQNSPLKGVELDLERDTSTEYREVAL